jgi:hypothetical protein
VAAILFFGLPVARDMFAIALSKSLTNFSRI